MPGTRGADAGQAREAAPRRDGWAFEVKWDGVRAIAFCEPGRLRLQSRNLKDITAQYPEVRGLRAAARRARRGPRRRAGRLRRGRAAQLRAPAAADPPDLRGACGGGCVAPGHLRDLRPALPRRRGPDGPALRQAPRAARGAGAGGASWQTPAYHRGDGAALLRRERRAGARGRSSPSGSTAPTSRAGAAALAQGEERRQRRSSSSAAGCRARAAAQAASARSWSASASDDGRAPLRRAGRHRVHREDLDDLAQRLAPLERDDSPFDKRARAEGGALRRATSCAPRSSSANARRPASCARPHTRDCARSPSCATARSRWRAGC